MYHLTISCIIDCLHMYTYVHLISIATETQFSTCTTGEVRVVGNDDGNEGRLEVCVNSAWGTVCSNEFGPSDAAVACEALGGFRGNGESIAQLSISLQDDVISTIKLYSLEVVYGAIA